MLGSELFEYTEECILLAAEFVLDIDVELSLEDSLVEGVAEGFRKDETLIAKRSVCINKLSEQGKSLRDVDERFNVGVDSMGVLEVDCCTCPDRKGGLHQVETKYEIRRSTARTVQGTHAIKSDSPPTHSMVTVTLKVAFVLQSLSRYRLGDPEAPSPLPTN